jgi:mono/diheme cytochrome c family protein
LRIIFSVFVVLFGITCGADDALYKVQDGYKVDSETMKGFRTWRAAACDRCHGANQQGLVGPSLIERLKTLTKDDFVKTVTEGRLEKGMPSFKTSKTVMTNIDHLYAYLKGRSDGAITRSKVEEIQ